MSTPFEVFAPGRVNLIGEHTDYTNGLVFPIALELGITVSGTRGGDRVVLNSDSETESFEVAVPFQGSVADVEPAWGRFVAALAKLLPGATGIQGSVSSTLPAGGTGLSSSSALTVGCLLAMAGDGDRIALAKLARAAEIEATGVNIGLMDQLASLCGRAGHALLIDCHDLTIQAVPVPTSMEVLVVHTGQSRKLAESAYNERRASTQEIERLIGPLRLAKASDAEALSDPVLRRRARHVVSENQRVRDMAEAFRADDPVRAGEVLADGHRSLSADFEVSTAVVDEIVAAVAATPGVYGARLTGGGFGGSLVALCEPGVEPQVDTWWCRARPGPGATITRP